MKLHPEFDVETETWFVPDTPHEAKTLCELQAIVGKRTRLIGYYPSGFGLIQQEGFAVFSKYVKMRPPNPAQWREHGKVRLPPSAPKPKPKLDVEGIIDDWAAGISIHDIASKHEITVRYVQYLISGARRQGDLRAKPRDHYRHHRPPIQLRTPLIDGERWSRDDLVRIQKYIKDGLTYFAIGNIFHTTRSAIAGVVKRNKLNIYR